jgi:dTDP-4-dehydrorhamnose reductase
VLTCAVTESLARIFDREGGQQFDYVFNCGGETRYSQEDEVYKTRSYGLAMAVGKEAAKRKVKCFVEISTGMVYKPDSVPRKETDKLKPWSKLAKWKLTAEEDLAKIEGLNLLIMRLSHVYGPYTRKFLSTALCMARVYQFQNQEMKWLWKEDLRTNTVHILDVVRALWTGVEWYVKAPRSRSPAPTFNIVDHGNTCKLQNARLSIFLYPQQTEHVPRGITLANSRPAQGDQAKLMHDIFNIATGFHGTLISAYARLNIDRVVDEVNNDTLDPWADLQTKAGISQSTPLTPFMEKELLRDMDLSLNGSLFEKETGFQYVGNACEVLRQR